MPQLNVAPSPVVAPPASANAASPDAPSSGAPDGTPAEPFAAVLKQQVSQQEAAAKTADKSGAKSAAKADPKSDPATLTDAAADPASAAQPGADAIAAIAQMLGGIAPHAPAQQPAQADTAQDRKGKQSAPDEGADPVVVAMAGLPAAPTTVSAASNPASATDAMHRGQATPGIAAGRTENLAADVQGAASHAASAKEGTADFASLLAAPREAQSAATAQAAPRTEANPVQVDTPVGTRGWGDEIGQKLTWMVNKHETRADLVLNPPELGRIEVSISMKGDHASASFVSANPIVRDAIENAVPRLREVLQDAGISLGQTQVGAESFQQSSGSRENGDNSWRGANAGATIVDAVTGGLSGASAAASLRRGNGMVDTFA